MCPFYWLCDNKTIANRNMKREYWGWKERGIFLLKWFGSYSSILRLRSNRTGLRRVIYCNKIERSHYLGWSAILSWMGAYIRGARYSVFAHIRSRYQSRALVTYGWRETFARRPHIQGLRSRYANISRGAFRGDGRDVSKDAIFFALSDDDPCLVKYCGVGRECQVSADGEELVAACVCIHKCARRHRPVCASNGRVYVNHCEMHRAACNADTPLTTRRLSRCLSNGEHVLDSI